MDFEVLASIQHRLDPTIPKLRRSDHASASCYCKQDDVCAPIEAGALILRSTGGLIGLLSCNTRPIRFHEQPQASCSGDSKA